MGSGTGNLCIMTLSFLRIAIFIFVCFIIAFCCSSYLRLIFIFFKRTSFFLFFSIFFIDFSSLIILFLQHLYFLVYANFVKTSFFDYQNQCQYTILFPVSSFSSHIHFSNVTSKDVATFFIQHFLKIQHFLYFFQHFCNICPVTCPTPIIM